MDKAARELLGQQIRRNRQRLGFSQKELASRIGINAIQTISKLENGHSTPSMMTLSALSRVFQLPVWRFFIDDRLVPAADRLRPGEAAILEALSPLSDTDLDSLRQMVEAFARSRS